METDNQNGMDYNEEEVCQTQAALKVDQKNDIECSEEEVSQTPEALKADNHNKEEVCKKKQILKVKNTNNSTNKLSEIEASLSKKIDTDLGEVKSDMGILGGKLDFGLSGLDKKIEELDLKFEGALQEEKDVNVGRVNDLKMALEEEKLLRVQDIEIAKNNLLEKIQEERSALEDKNAEVIKMIDEDREDLAHLGKKIDGEKRERGKLLSELEYKMEDDLSKCTNKINTDIGAMREDLEKESAQNKADSQRYIQTWTHFMT
ncbi:Hypothetical protein FKW44_021403 [Caligus rogercresseyi]|uniref:Uncharacterized protein n=1 Tax=Caligus rogercresseyi TaxID=217165 RepID=A0A7T8GRA4_CALRO|nr:Hypothetical protein FKW44_021403 [Caligus rogercresseyi]